MAFSFSKFFGGINLKPNSVSQVTSLGDLDVTTDGNLNFHNGTVSTVFVSTTQPATLTNKTIDADANFISNIDDGNIKAGANIAVSKLAPLTVDRALISDSSGVVSVSTVTATELGYVSGVTSGIQAQINALVGTNAITALTGDVTATGPGSVAAIIANGAVTNAKLANLAVDNSKVSSSAAIAYTKLNLANSIAASDMNSGVASNGAVLTANGSGAASYVAPPTTLTISATTNSGASIPAFTPTTVIFDDEIIDTASAYNPITGEFTVPTSGNYHIFGNIASAGTTAATTLTAQIRVNGVDIVTFQNAGFFNGGAYGPITQYLAILPLITADVVVITIAADQITAIDTNSPNRTTFNVIKIN